MRSSDLSKLDIHRLMQVDETCISIDAFSTCISIDAFIRLSASWALIDTSDTLLKRLPYGNKYDLI
jgi:hypothetical protein